jgi:hypothetical protein
VRLAADGDEVDPVHAHEPERRRHRVGEGGGAGEERRLVVEVWVSRRGEYAASVAEPPRADGRPADELAREGERAGAPAVGGEDDRAGDPTYLLLEEPAGGHRVAAAPAPDPVPAAGAARLEQPAAKRSAPVRRSAAHRRRREAEPAEGGGEERRVAHAGEDGR